MKKIILVLSIFCLISCNQKVNLNEESHLELFNLKGKVKEINFDYTLNEITDISYKPIGKANPRFFDLGIIGDIDLSYPRALSKLDFYYHQIFFDSNNIFLSEMLNKSYYANKCDSYKIEFNKNGKLISFEGYKNKKGIIKIYCEYTDNNITKIKKAEDSKNEQLGAKSDIVYEYQYNKFDLLSSKKETNSNGYSLNSTFNYIFDKHKKEFNIKEDRLENFSDNRTKKSQFEYTLTINNENKIDKIIYDKENKTISFLDGKIKKIIEYDNDGKLIFSIELNYVGGLIADLKKTKYDILNEVYFEYEENGNLKSIKCNDESKKEFTNSLKFNYKFDHFKNWTKQIYVIDRSKYDNYIQFLKKRETFSNDFYERYGHSPFTFKEDVNVEIEKNLLKEYSSKIEVERNIIYY